MARGVADRRHPARHPTFVTMADAGPQARTVVLRGWQDGQAEFHTDKQSAKVVELEAEPRAALHVWVPKQKLQIRLNCLVELVHSDPQRWDRVPEAARGVYGGSHAPGAVLDRPEDFEEAPDQARFTAVLARVQTADLLHLGDDRHRRAVYHRSDSAWLGQWLAP
jgi:pyridoxamine 5'-phosphate oxidase